MQTQTKLSRIPISKQRIILKSRTPSPTIDCFTQTNSSRNNVMSKSQNSSTFTDMDLEQRNLISERIPKKHKGIF